MRHIIPISGKDSCCTAIVQMTFHPELDYELFFNDIGAELPETYVWLNEVEKKLGRKIHRVGKSLEKIIAEEGILPAPKTRFCTRKGKIKPMEEWIGEDEATIYFGIRADEDRIGYNPLPNITPKYPLREYGIGLDQVYQIIDKPNLRPPRFFWKRVYEGVVNRLEKKRKKGFGLRPVTTAFLESLPAFVFDRLFTWRSRPNCYFCFFQSKWEWVGLLEHHPDLFDRAEQIELRPGVIQERERAYGWIEDCPLAKIRENKEIIVNRRIVQIIKILQTKRIKEDSNDLLAVTSCGLFCGK